jgi:hypothetical protein
MFLLFTISLLITITITIAKKDIPCEWSSHAGSSYDLKPLKIQEKSKVY